MRLAACDLSRRHRHSRHPGPTAMQQVAAPRHATGGGRRPEEKAAERSPAPAGSDSGTDNARLGAGRGPGMAGDKAWDVTTPRGVSRGWCSEMVAQTGGGVRFISLRSPQQVIAAW